VPEPTPILDVVQPDNTCSNLPSELWRSTFLARFRNLRKVNTRLPCEWVLTHGHQNIAQPTIHVHIDPDGSRKVMPDKKERDLWWKFLTGLPESDWNPPKKPKKPSKKSRFSGHMQALCDEPEVAHDINDEHNHDETHETWRINSEGDVELAEDDLADASRSIVRQPHVGPAFPISTGETASATCALSNYTCHDQPRYPREITPSLLRKIDHVRV
jgi:hypothetical protein